MAAALRQDSFTLFCGFLLLFLARRGERDRDKDRELKTRRTETIRHRMAGSGPTWTPMRSWAHSQVRAGSTFPEHEIWCQNRCSLSPFLIRIFQDLKSKCPDAAAKWEHTGEFLTCWHGAASSLPGMVSSLPAFHRCLGSSLGKMFGSQFLKSISQYFLLCLPLDPSRFQW